MTTHMLGLVRDHLLDDAPERVYGSNAAARIAGISYRQIDHWERMGVLAPSVKQATGSGTSRQYSQEDVEVLSIFAELVHLGAHLANLSEAERPVRKAIRGGSRWLLISPGGVLEESCGDSMATLMMEMHGVSGAWFVDMHTVLSKVRERGETIQELSVG